MIFNVKDFKGTLCLSIHPLDFMTMSDNESRWESCMSWRNEGCYRQGTIEMMNSPCVVIAYLKNEEDMNLCGGYTWNNKRWRELFIVNEKCITNIKSYPYTSEVLTKEVLSWLVDLARTNKGLTYDQPFEWQSGDGYPYFNMKYINFETSYMYNDITADSTRIHYMYVAPGVTDIDINYSGDFVCMECGECNEPSEYDGSTGTLICYKCEPSYYCYECGDRYYEDGLHYVDGNYYCEYCYDRLHTDALTELVIGSSHDVEITIIPKNRDDSRWKTFHLHQDTLENNELLRKSFKAIYKGYYKVESRYGGEYVQGTGLFVLEEDIEEEVLDYILDYASSYYPTEFNTLFNWDINNTRVLELNNILNHYCLVDDIVKKEGVSVTLKFCP